MSLQTPYFQLILPTKGEFKGNWSTPINDNFVSIDSLLAVILASNAGPLSPQGKPDGSWWFNTVSRQMMLKVSGSYVRSTAHLHDDIDLPKIDLARHTFGTLPASMIDTVGLSATYLGGLTKDEMLYKVGDGLYKSGPTVSLNRVFQDSAPRTFNNVNVDIYGRVVSGSQIPVTSHTHTEYALKDGDLLRQFNVATPTIASHAVPFLYAENRYHPKGGSASAVFKVFNATNTDDAINLGQATALFAVIAHTHPYSSATHLHDDRYSALAHTHSEFSLITGVTGGLDSTYAKINGDNLIEFHAANPTGPNGVVNVAHAEDAYIRKDAPDAAITDASPSVAAPTKAEFDAVVTKLNAALAALRNHYIIS